MFTLPQLPYATTAFGDLISAETFEYHHGKHHKAYVDKANKLVAEDQTLAGKSLVELIQKAKGGLFNQVGQIWNHSFYWQCLSPEAKSPSGKLAEMIASQFGSHANLLAKLKEEATGHFPCRNGQTGRQAGEGEQMKEAWERFENSPAAGLVVVVVWCGMLLSLLWMATV